MSDHDHALCLAGFLAFVRGVDIPETIEQARVALIERALKANAALRTALGERDQWLTAALFKLRTWETIQGRHRAGEAVDAVADDYGVPVRWVQAVVFPENDLDARYGRPSDRTTTMRARAEQADAQLAALSAALRTLRERAEARIKGLRVEYGHMPVERRETYDYDMEFEAAIGELQHIVRALLALVPSAPTLPENKV